LRDGEGTDSVESELAEQAVEEEAEETTERLSLLSSLLSSAMDDVSLSAVWRMAGNSSVADDAMDQLE